MTLFLVRHGTTEPNERGVLLGRRADPSLVDVGRGQAEATGQALARRRPTAVVSSPLRRCLETAETIAGVLSLDVVVEPRLVEVDYGEWEGVALGEIPPGVSRKWRHDPDFRPPGGETLAEVSTRVTEWCQEHESGGSVVAVTHVSPVKAAVAWALGAPPTVAWRLLVSVASVTTIGVQPHGPVLLGFNDCGHLAPLAPEPP